MNLLTGYFEENLRIWGVVFFSLFVVVGLFVGYYPKYKKQLQVTELIKTNKEYKQVLMSDLSFQIRHFSVFADDQIPQSN